MKHVELGSFRAVFGAATRITAAFLALNASFLPNARAQAQSDPAVSFDVASLKPVQPKPPYPVLAGRTLHGATELTNLTLAECLRFAFGITSDDQIAGPGWIKSADALLVIVGKAPPDTPPAKVRQMVLTLLTDRFSLKLHHEKREIPFFALVVDKKGANLHEAAASPTGTSELRQGRIVLPRASMATLILALGRLATGRPIVDMTELKGSYSVKLEWTPLKQGAGNLDGAADPAALPAGQTLFEAMTEQLGLRLEMRKGPMDVIVVDSANRTPMPN